VTPSPDGRTDKAAQFLEAWGQIIATGDSRGRDSDDAVLGKDKNDVERRLLRLDHRIKNFEGDERFADLVKKASEDFKSLEGRVKQERTAKKPNWKTIYNDIGRIDRTLDKTIELREKAEEKGGKDAPDATKAIEQIEEYLNDPWLTAAQRKGFLASLTGVRKGVVAVGYAAENDKQRVVSEVTQSASDLRGRITDAIANNKVRANQLRVQYTATMKVLAGLPDDDSDMTEEGGRLREARSSASVLLGDADGALNACDFDLAETKIIAAQNALVPFKDKAIVTATADDVARDAEALRKEWIAFAGKTRPLIQNEFKKLIQAKQPLPNGARDMFDRGEKTMTGVLEQLNVIVFMAKKGSARDAAVMLENCRKQTALAEQLWLKAASLLPGVDKSGLPPQSEAGKEMFKEDAASLEQTKRSIDGEIASLRQLVTEVYGASTDDHPPGGAAVDLKEIEGRWEEAKKTAFLAADLEAAAYLRELAAVRGELEKKKALKAKGGFGPEDVAFDKQAVAAREAIAALHESAQAAMGLNSDEAIKAGLTTRPAVLEVDAEALIEQQERSRGAPGDVVKRTEALRAKTQEIEQLTARAERIKQDSDRYIKDMRQNCRDWSTQMRGDIGVGQRALEAKRKSGSGSVKGDDREAAKKYAEQLLSEIEAALVPVKNDDVSILRDVLDKLIALRPRVDSFKEMTKGGGEKHPFTDVKKKANEIKLQLQYTLIATVPARVEALKTQSDRLDKIIADFNKLDPATTMTELNKIAGEIKTARETADKEHQEATALIEKFNQQRARIEFLARDKQNEKYAGYCKAIISRIDAKTAEIKKRDKVLDDDDKSLQNFNTEGDAVANHDTTALDKGQQQVDKAEEELKAAKDLLQSLEDVNLKLLAEDVKTMAKEPKARATSQMKDLKGQIARGLKDLKKTKDVAAARGLAEAIERTINSLREAPMGTATHKRNQLPTVEAEWRGAVEAMVRALDGLPGAVETAAKDDTEEMKTEVKGAAGELVTKLAEVKKLFRLDAFNVVVKRMTANGASDADIAAAKQDGLREVRRLRKFMESQRTLRLVAAIPDSFKADVPLARLSSALFDMETNLTISG
jgi:hypothetical protein